MATDGEVRLASLAAYQLGAFSRKQALAHVSRQVIRHRLRSGRWRRVHAGVYVDSAVPRTFEQQATAACLACCPGAVASHRTAAKLLGLDAMETDPIEVTVPPGRQADPTGVEVYRTRRLDRRDVASANRVPVTAPMRTLADLARILDTKPLELALDGLWRRGSVDPARLGMYLDGHPSRTGSGVLRALVRDRIGQRPPGSDNETIYLQILRDFGIPLPVRQYEVMTRSGRRFIDLAYPEARVAIEIESMGYHLYSREAFDDGYVRRNDLDELGWTVKGFTDTHIRTDHLYVAITTATAIGLKPARWVRCPA